MLDNNGSFNGVYHTIQICVIVVQVCTVLHAVCWRVSPSAMFLETQLHTMLPPNGPVPWTASRIPLRSMCSPKRQRAVACPLLELDRRPLGLWDKTRKRSFTTERVTIWPSSYVSQLQFLWVNIPLEKVEETRFSPITWWSVEITAKSLLFCS